MYFLRRIALIFCRGSSLLFSIVVFFQELFVKENIRHLLRINAGSLLLDVCSKLPLLDSIDLLRQQLVVGEATRLTLTSEEGLALQDK